MFRFHAIAAVALLGAGGPPGAAAEEPAPIYAVSDVHGAYEPFVEVLRTAGLVDASQQWAGGTARLVVVGDVLDRGARSRDVLELVIALQDAAARAGGAVHFVLGNHEVMNLVGDLGYVSAAEFAAFAAEEEPAEREAAWQRFLAAESAADEGAARAKFDERYPPGFFGHRAAFSRAGRYGRWLLEQPVLLVLDGTAFVHGGLAEEQAGSSAAAINAAHERALHEYLSAFETLVAAGALHAEDAFADRPAAAAKFAAAAAAAGRRLDEPVLAAVARLEALTRSPLLGPAAVYWYRGSVACSPAVEQDRLTRVLDGIDAERVVVGHTPTVPRGVLTHLEGRLYRVDTGMLRDHYGGNPAAVAIRGDVVEALYPGIGGAARPERQAVGVAAAAVGVSDSQLEDWLARAPITAQSSADGGAVRITLDVDGRQLGALFRPAARDNGALHEVAAYRLDRMLELGLVPTAVVREIDGRIGAVQIDVAAWPDERARRAGAQDSVEWCPLGDQFGLMYLFDALAGSERRSAGQLHYVPGRWQLALTDNRGLFPTRDTLPEHVRELPIRLSPTVARRLRQLTADTLAAELADVLDERRRNALLERRDRLLVYFARN